MSQLRALNVRCLDGAGRLRFEIHAVGNSIEEAAPDNPPPLRVGRELPSPTEIVTLAQGLWLQVALQGHEPEEIVEWSQVLFPHATTAVANSWLGEAAVAAAETATRWTNEASQTGDPPLRLRRYAPVLSSSGISPSPVTAHSCTFKRRELTTWRRIANSDFMIFQREMSRMIRERAPGPSVPALTCGAHYNLQLLTVACAASHLQTASQLTDAAVLAFFLETDSAKGSRRSTEAEVRQRLASRSSDIEHLHHLLDGVRTASSDYTVVHDYEPPANYPMLKKQSVEEVAVLLNIALDSVTRALGLFTSAITTASSARDARFQEVAAVVASVLLVPTLVAGIYGSNVNFPGRDSPEGFVAMLVWMLTGSVSLWAALRRFQRAPVVPGRIHRSGACWLLYFAAIGSGAAALALTNAPVHLRVAVVALACALGFLLYAALHDDVEQTLATRQNLADRS